MAYNGKKILISGTIGVIAALIIISAFIGTGILPVPPIGPGPSSQTNTGELVIRITDAPADLKHLNLTIDSFDVKTVKTNWTEIPILGGSISFDLLQLQDSSIVAAIGELEPGNYSIIRMHILEGLEHTNATKTNNQVIPINVPSDKITIITPKFEIRSDEITTILLDLQVDSIHLANNPQHNLAPAMKIKVSIMYEKERSQALIQNHYMWFLNDYVENPTFVDDEDSPIDDVASGDILRLRISIRNSGIVAWGDSVKLKLQYSTDVDRWFDVEQGNRSGAEWVYYDGLATNKDEVENLLLSDSTIKEHFVESSPTAIINQIPINGQGEWDICIRSKDIASDTTYFFRLVLSDNTILDVYDVYPTLTTIL